MSVAVVEPPAAPLLDPRLLMAARRGDSKRLKELLRLDDDDDEEEEKEETAVIVGVVAPRRPPAPPPLEGVTLEGNTLLHVVAASGDGHEFLRCVKMIVRDKEKKGGAAAAHKILHALNHNGDTPLHCAAGAGNCRMISRLVALATGGDTAHVKTFLRLRNRSGETALHNAVRAASKAAIDQLLSVDPELACSSRAEREGGEDHHQGASPLYLAVSLGEMDIARHLYLLDATTSRCTRNLSFYSGPDGRNVLHAAVSRGRALPKLLEWFKDEVVDIVVQEEEGDRDAVTVSVPLVSQLTSQHDKENGSTPLHLAAALWRWPFAWILICRQVWILPSSATRLLLDANVSTAYQPDKKGMYPIHVAAGAGSLGVVKILLERCPECATLRDAKGRTFLHIAAAKKRRRVVKHVCATPDLSSILNMQDINGDTALHRAVHAGDLSVFNYLLANRRVRLDLPNKEAMTPADLSLSKTPTKFNYQLNTRYRIRETLLYFGGPYGESRADLFCKKHYYYPKVKAGGEDSKISQHLTAATQGMGIVSVLVATVTYASAFTLPGGYRSGDSGGGDPAAAAAGTPLLAGSYAFNAFVLADAMAFICSCLATFSLVYAGLPSVDLSIRFTYITVAAVLLMNSARSLAVAFALGLYVVLAPVARPLAIAVCVLLTLACLLFGNSEAWRIMATARVVQARFGSSRRVQAPVLFTFLMVLVVYFWSFIIIFGLPAIIRN